MSKKYVIQWKSKVNGRTGRGTRSFDRQEAERLAAEFNREYPDIEHEVVGAEPQGEPVAARRTAGPVLGRREKPFEPPSPEPARALSFK